MCCIVRQLVVCLTLTKFTTQMESRMLALCCIVRQLVSCMFVAYKICSNTSGK